MKFNARQSWLLAVLLAGCGATTNEHPTAELAGSVTIDGQPVEQGNVQFMPLGAGQPAAGTIVEGRYVAEQVPTGKVRVIISALRPTGRILNEGGHQVTEYENIVPRSDRAGIELVVEGDNDQQDFHLPTR